MGSHENDGAEKFPVRHETPNHGYAEDLSKNFVQNTTLDDIRLLNKGDHQHHQLENLFGDPKDPFNQKKDLEDGWYKSLHGWGDALKKAFGGGEKLSEVVGKQVDKEMTPAEKKQYETEKKDYDQKVEEYNKKFLQWATQANINAKMPEFEKPDMKDYPMMQEREKRIEQKEQDIRTAVLNGMSPEEREKLGTAMKQWDKDMDDARKMMDRNVYVAMPGPPDEVRHYFDKIRHATESGAVAVNDRSSTATRNAQAGVHVVY